MRRWKLAASAALLVPLSAIVLLQTSSSYSRRICRRERFPIKTCPKSLPLRCGAISSLPRTCRGK